MDEHIKNCSKVGAQKTIFPSKDNKFISFKKYRNKILAPFVVYADFEALNVPFYKNQNLLQKKNQYQPKNYHLMKSVVMLIN